jgi:hypothetical protein
VNTSLTIREGRNGRYRDVLDAAEYHADKHGGGANALAQMARESSLFAEWLEADVAKTVDTKALPPDTRESETEMG